MLNKNDIQVPNTNNSKLKKKKKKKSPYKLYLIVNIDFFYL